MNPSFLKAPLVNSYLAHKQCPLPGTRLTDAVQTTRDIVALHATDPTGPYFSLWARVSDFQREVLEDALSQAFFERRTPALPHTLHPRSAQTRQEEVNL